MALNSNRLGKSQSGFFYLEPEVAGSLGERTIMNRSVHPPVIERLHYIMEGWLGDAVLESFPVFIITEEAKNVLLAAGVTGTKFDKFDISFSADFLDRYPSRMIPSFFWLKIIGLAGRDDIGVGFDGRLVVSEKVLNALHNLGTSHAIVEPFETPNATLQG